MPAAEPGLGDAHRVAVELLGGSVISLLVQHASVIPEHVCIRFRRRGGHLLQNSDSLAVLGRRGRMPAAPLVDRGEVRNGNCAYLQHFGLSRARRALNEFAQGSLGIFRPPCLKQQHSEGAQQRRFVRSGGPRMLRE
jgi:hypothetical protein